MRRLGASSIGLKRTAFQDLKRLTLLLAYGIEDSPWRARTGFVAARPRPAQPEPDHGPDPTRGRDARCRRGRDRVRAGRWRHGRDARGSREAGARPRAGGDGRRGGVRWSRARRPRCPVPGPGPRGDQRSLDLHPGRERGRRRVGRQLGLVVAGPRRGARRVAGRRRRRRPGRALRGDRGRHRGDVGGESAQRPQRPARRRPRRDGPPVAGHPPQRPRLRRLRAVRRRLPERSEAVRAPAVARVGVRARGRGPGPHGGPARDRRGRPGHRRRRARPRRRDHGPRANGGARRRFDPLPRRPPALRDRPGRRRPDAAHPPGDRRLGHLRRADGALVRRPPERHVGRLRRGRRARGGSGSRPRRHTPGSSRAASPGGAAPGTARRWSSRDRIAVLPGDRARPRHRARGRRARRLASPSATRPGRRTGSCSASRPSSWRGSTGRPARSGSCRS